MGTPPPGFEVDKIEFRLCICPGFPPPQNILAQYPLYLAFPALPCLPQPITPWPTDLPLLLQSPCQSVVASMGTPPTEGPSMARASPPRDLFLLGKLVIPNSLQEALNDHLGSRNAKRSISHFQHHILDHLFLHIPLFSPAARNTFRKRPNPWTMTDWISPP